MLRRLAWAVVNSGLWLAALAAAIVTVLHPDSAVRAVGLAAALAGVAAWIAHTLTDHYSDVMDEHEHLAHRRDVVFGYQAEAERAAMARISSELRALAQRRRFPRLPRPGRRRPTVDLATTWLGQVTDGGDRRGVVSHLR